MNGEAYFTSNNQLVCLANQALTDAGRDPTTGWVFDNCTVIRMNDQGFTMIHPKQVSDIKRFVTPEKFNETFQGVPSGIPTGKVVYLFRHGHALHNDPLTTFQHSHDASLTQKGIEQAQNASASIQADADFAQIHGPIALYCSDLCRTWETAKIFHDLIPKELQAGKVSICLEAHEYTRAIGAIQHWEKTNPMRKIAINPFLSVEEVSVLAPTKTKEEIARMMIENCPKNDPRKNWQACMKNIGDFKLDWSDYISKLDKAESEGKNYGDAASEKLLLEVIRENAAKL